MPRSKKSSPPALADLLCEAREASGLSIRQLAEQSGVDKALISRIEASVNKTAQLGTLNKLATRLAGTLHRKLTTAIPGTSIKKLDVGPVAIYYGVSGGTIVISDASSHIIGPVGTSITSDPTFTKAKSAAGLPDQSSGFVYANIKNAVPLIEGFAQAAGSAIPPEVSQNLAPLESFLAYATSSGGVVKFSVLLQAR